MVSISKAREEFDAAARELVEINKEARRTNDFSRLQAASERLSALRQQLAEAEAGGEPCEYDILPLTALVQRKLRETFSAADQAEAVSLLEEGAGRNLPLNDPPNLDNLERIRLALIKLAEGKLSELKQRIAIAKKDWREVLVPAETPEALAYGLVELMNADPGTRDEIQSRDRQQYENWLKGDSKES